MNPQERGSTVHWPLHLATGMYCVVALILLRFASGIAIPALAGLFVLPVALLWVFGRFDIVLTLFVGTIPFVQHFSWLSVPVGDFNITPHMFAFVIVVFSFINRHLQERSPSTGAFDRVDQLIVMMAVFSIIPLLFGYSLPVNHEKRWLLFYTGIVETTAYLFVVRIGLRQGYVTPRRLLIALMMTSFASAIIAGMELSKVGFNLLNIYSSRVSIGFGYHNTNLFGIHASLLFPLIFSMAVNETSKGYRSVSLASLAVLLTLSILCFNRGTLIVLLFQVILLSLRKENRSLLFVLSAVAVIVLVLNIEIIVFYLSRFIIGSGSAETTLIDRSAQYRLDAWSVGAMLLWKYPFGIGAGSFQHMWEIYGTQSNFYLGTPHHLFLSIGVDYGVPALILFLMVLFSAVRLSRTPSASLPAAAAVYYRYAFVSLAGFLLYGVLTDGELSHLSGFRYPNNGYTLILYTVIAVLFDHHRKASMEHGNG